MVGALGIVLPLHVYATNGMNLEGYGPEATAMGTEYSSTSWMSNPGQLATSPNLINRSQVGVGRVILPLVVYLSDRVSIGGSVDFVWAGMDLKMAMSET